MALVILTSLVGRAVAQTRAELDSMHASALNATESEVRGAAWLSLAQVAHYGFPEIAVQAAERAIEFSSTDDTVLATMGNALREADEPRRSVRYLNEALQQMQGATSTFPEAHLGLARSLVATQQYQLADSVLSIVKFSPTTSDLFKAQVHTALGDIRLGQYKEQAALSAYHDARSLLQTLKRHERSEAHLLVWQSESYLNADLLDTALTLAQRAVELFAEINDPVGAARAERSIGNVYTVIGDYAKAASHLERATQLARKAGSRRLESMALNGLAYNAFLMLEPKVVESYWLKALALADSIDSPGTAARVRIHYGNFFLAPSTIEAYGITAEEGFTRARTIIEPAIAHFETTGDERLRTAALMTLSNIHQYSGDTESSRKVDREVFRIGQRIADRKMMARSLVSTGSSYLVDRNYRRTIRTLDSALVLCTQASMGSTMGSVMYRLSLAHEELGHYAEALSFMKKRNILLDSLSDETKYRDMGILEAEHNAAELALADSLEHASALRAVEDSRTIAELRAERTQAWMAGIGFLVVIGALGTWLFIRTDRNRRQARYAMRTAQLETKALRAQMNPHFLFNALASINGFIGRNQPDAAKEFVARFGKLTRAVLENSMHNEVPLEKDLEALELYLQLEQARSGNKFDYQVVVDPAIDRQLTRVPPLVIQPFVENAIWHGVAKLEGRGKIEVHIKEQGDQLLLHVQDDGVGMRDGTIPVAGAEKTSLGLGITRSRLDLVQQIKGRPAGFRYIEAMRGTHVEVSLPI